MYDIIIVGSGIVGAATALALARETSLKIAVIEAKMPADENLDYRSPHFLFEGRRGHGWHEASRAGCPFPKTRSEGKDSQGPDVLMPYDHRVSAISLASKNILHNLHCWDAIKAKRISPYTHMHVWDSIGIGKIHFDSASVGESVLGYIIEDSVIRKSLHEQFQRYSNIDFLCPIKLNQLKETADYIELITSDQKTIQTKLLIGADGAHSWVRANSNIDLTQHDYAHTAIVTTVKTELPHQKTARQYFLPTGPLAFLPLSDLHHCSIVWSATHEYANDLLALDDAAFCKKITTEFGKTLGDVTHATSRYHFPLQMRHVKNYVRSRLALVGDAAHTIHPLAGQGVNLGLLDGAALAEIVIDAHKKNRDFASLATLRRYERWRKGDTTAMLTLVSGLKQLFGSDKKSLQQIRNAGLNVTNQLPFLKNALMNYALGKREGLPKLAKFLQVIV